MPLSIYEKSKYRLRDQLIGTLPPTRRNDTEAFFPAISRLDLKTSWEGCKRRGHDPLFECLAEILSLDRQKQQEIFEGLVRYACSLRSEAGEICLSQEQVRQLNEVVSSQLSEAKISDAFLATFPEQRHIYAIGQLTLYDLSCLRNYLGHVASGLEHPLSEACHDTEVSPPNLSKIVDTAEMLFGAHLVSRNAAGNRRTGEITDLGRSVLAVTQNVSRDFIFFVSVAGTLSNFEHLRHVKTIRTAVRRGSLKHRAKLKRVYDAD